MLTKAERTKQFIIERSAPVFNTKGYAATSLNDILAVTGMAKGGVYGNFENKDEIAIAAFDFNYGKVRSALGAKVAAQSTAVGKLQAILKFYHNYTINTNFIGGCPVQNTAIDADDHIPFLKDKASAALQDMLSALENIFRKGVSSGEFKKDLNVKAKALLFFSIIEGGIMMSKVTDKPELLNKLLQQLKQQVQTRFI